MADKDQDDALIALQRDAASLRSDLEGFSEIFADVLVRCTAAIVVDLTSWTILASTAPADAIFGYMEGELAGKSLDVLIPDAKRAAHAQHVAGYAAHPTPRIMGGSNTDLVGKRRDGSTFKVAIGLYPRVIRGRRCVVATILEAR